MSNASAIDHVSVDGDYEVTIHLSGDPCPAFLYILNDTSMKILSEKAVTEAGDTYGEAPIGTGPFMFKKSGFRNDHWTLRSGLMTTF
ncbi:MAG: ABC transporter substrate-binding protein [Roseburia sp.]